MKLWDKGFSTDQKIDFFTVGNDRYYDEVLAKYDVQASIAHARMLGEVDLLSKLESEKLLLELEQILKEIQKGEFKIEQGFEDMHSKIEQILTDKLGDVGKKIHMARSRNDQVLVAVHLYLRDVLKDIKVLVHSLFNVLMDLAEKHQKVSLPGYTHLQVAMPSSFGLWFSAYAESFIDDIFFVDAAYSVINQNPLGSAAGYGSSFPIDREMTTKELSFATLKYNVIASQMSRGKSEKSVSIALSMISATLSKMAMDICLYMSQNFDFISFPNELTTGSSIMPHKKNPDVFELIRAKCNIIQGMPNQFSLMMNNLPSGYHRDFQLCKELIMPAVEQLKSSLEMMIFSLPQVQVRKDILDDDKYNYLYSVDTLNDMILKQNIPFRDAYKKIGRDIDKGNYQPIKDSKHTHQGGKDHLCLDEIREKMNHVLNK